MRPLITLSRLRSAIKRGNVAGVEQLLPDFLEKTQDIPEYRDTLMFDVARVFVATWGGVGEALCLTSGRWVEPQHQTG